MKLVVEVHNASNLMPKDGQGSASPFVEVGFEDQKQRTQTKSRDLNPFWNERLQFNVSDPDTFPDQIIDVIVYNERRGGGGGGDGITHHHNNFLGRVRIAGVSVPESEASSAVQRYPLDKRGLFSHIRGDIALKIYAVHDYPATTAARSDGFEAPISPQFETGVNGGTANGSVKKNGKISKGEKKAKEPVQSFFSIPSKDAAGSDFFKIPSTTASAAAAGGGGEKRAEVFKAEQPAPMAVHQMQVAAAKRTDFDPKETYPPLPGLLRKQRKIQASDKTSSTFDLVEKMHYLYVNVVKAKDLPTMDITGSLDPYVVLKIGNYIGQTKIFEKNQTPVWKQVFAFSKDHLQSNRLDVIVRDKDMVKDDFVGKVTFDLMEVPQRAPPDSPLAPQWYRLEDRRGGKTSNGEIMLAVWMGTQADEAYSTARHSDTLNLSQEALAHTRSQVYYSPKLFYLRVNVLEAQDLVLSDRTRVPDAVARVQVGNQNRLTRSSAITRSANPMWTDDFLFVVSEPSNEFLMITVEDKVGPQKGELLGRLVLPVSAAITRLDHPKIVPSKWFNLESPSFSASVEEGGGEKKKEAKFSSKIHLRICLDAGYHVLDESTHFSSDLQPSAKVLRKPKVGMLELGILSARGLAMKNAYCVAKYGSKWVRTRTLLDTQMPIWNEQYTWEVFDPCTVVTIAVFDNLQVAAAKREDGTPSPKDQRIGKLRFRLSTLEAERIYTHFYPLLVLQPSGLKKMGELHLALRFTCVAWVNMLALYSRPLLPKMHYAHPIPFHNTDSLRMSAITIVAERLSRSEPPLRKEAVEYMLDIEYNLWSLRRSKANFGRITSVFGGASAVARWFEEVRGWKNPITTVLVHVLFLILVCYPELVLPTAFLYLFLIGVWNYRFRPRKPPFMDVALSHADRSHPDELDEEFDTFPTSRSMEVVRMRYDRMRSVAGRVQTVLGDLATQGERAQAILSWRDPRATGIFVVFSLALAVFLYVTPFQVVCVLVGLYLLRHPKFRSKKMPSVPFNFYKRLPSKSDTLI